MADRHALRQVGLQQRKQVRCESGELRHERSLDDAEVVDEFVKLRRTRRSSAMPSTQLHAGRLLVVLLAVVLVFQALYEHSSSSSTSMHEFCDDERARDRERRSLVAAQYEASPPHRAAAVEELARLARLTQRGEMDRALRISARKEAKFAATLDSNGAGARSTHGPTRTAREKAAAGAREPVSSLDVRGQHRSTTRDARSPDCGHPRARGEVRWVRLDKGYAGVVEGRRGEEVDQRENNSFRSPAARAASAPFWGTHK